MSMNTKLSMHRSMSFKDKLMDLENKAIERIKSDTHKDTGLFHKS